ncbi:hypothetical protein IJT93_04220 [bacterium]|nr:hypothetical protein [bacterium]
MENEFEARLNTAAEQLGKAMKEASKEERDALQKMYEKCKIFAASNPDEPGDVSALFALGIIGHKGINSEAVINAAIAYIDTDLEYCRARRKAN